LINAYRADGSLETLSASLGPADDAQDFVWIDLLNPSAAEDAFVEALLGIEVPTRDELKDIEPSSRLYTVGNAIFMTSSLVWRVESGEPALTDVAFILAGDTLLTVRYAEPKAFHLFVTSLGRRSGDLDSGLAVLSRLLETIADRTAEVLEAAVAGLDELSREIFRNRGKRRPPQFLENRLADIADQHRLVTKVRDSLGSLSRMLTFLRNLPALKQDRACADLCRTVAHDVETLSEHAAFIAGNISFLLDASLGLINVEQNAIIKIFSIASVVFLPPTLVASIYGMNFHFMPELDWTLGYPLALLAMLLSAVIPFFFFRWKGWL